MNYLTTIALGIGLAIAATARPTHSASAAPPPGRLRSNLSMAVGMGDWHVVDGVPRGDTGSAYQRRIRFLLQRQDDGLGLVTREAMPNESHLDVGWLYGQLPYLSYTATAWVTIALLLATRASGATPQTAAERSVTERNEDGTCR
jgi:hypothetical protein